MRQHTFSFYVYLLQDQVLGAYRILYSCALSVTSPSFDLDKTADVFQGILWRWADHELVTLGEWRDLEIPKAKVTQAFDELLAARKSKINQQLQCAVCVLCGSELSLGLFRQRGCLKCAKPVTDALMDLIRATTDRFTPEQIHAEWAASMDRLDTLDVAGNIVNSKLG